MENEKIVIVNSQIASAELKIIAKKIFGDMVKAVVDVTKEIMAIGGEMHYDEEQLLLQSGSKQEDLWGINLYVELTGNDFIEYDSMINIRPRQNNRSRSVEDQEVRKKIISVIDKLIDFKK